MGHILCCRPFVAYYTKFLLNTCISKIMLALAKKTAHLKNNAFILYFFEVWPYLTVSLTFIRHSNKILGI